MGRGGPWGGDGRLFEVGANSRLALIRINTVLCFRLLEYSIYCIVMLFSPSSSWFATT